MPTSLREATRTARKAHRCGACNGEIPIGTKHRVSTNVWDGRVYDWRTCRPCDDDHIIGEVYYWAGYPDEGVDYESAWEWAHEYRVSTSALGDTARRYLARTGCKCEQCEGGTP